VLAVPWKVVLHWFLCVHYLGMEQMNQISTSYNDTDMQRYMAYASPGGMTPLLRLPCPLHPM
jgi:hypothetical protein